MAPPMPSGAQAIRRSKPALSGMARPFLWGSAELRRFALAPVPRRGRSIEARRQKLAALRAVDVAQQRRRELVGGPVVNDLARSQRDRARAVRQRVLDLVQRDEDGDPILPVHVGENVHDPTRRGGIERSDRLIRDQKLGALHQGAGDGRALLLAAGEFRAALEGVLGHANARKRMHRPALFVHGEIAERSAHERHAAKQPEADIGEDRQSRHQVELLEDDADPNPQFLGAPRDAAVALYRAAEYGDGAGARLRGGSERFVDGDQARQRANERRFARAGCSDERHYLAAIDRELTSSSTRVPRSNDFETRRTSMTA